MERTLFSLGSRSSRTAEPLLDILVAWRVGTTDEILHQDLFSTSIPAPVSPDHNIKLKVSHGVVSRSDCSPPPEP
ncbi:hypothetical protein EYF80_002322 [Liparis tanakae]|uniref:Uncharacterized protein n=1 Tax=Liparis tanakae TaxID=230148 RepID=A0A4Z2JBA0_9TELE|nr:hypothetical protein EYF80_002322 [Liparis tanakae]